MLERLFYLQSRNEELLQDQSIFVEMIFETQRGGISYFYREQAFREGSLRGFEGAMRNDLGGVFGRNGNLWKTGIDIFTCLRSTELRSCKRRMGDSKDI